MCYVVKIWRREYFDVVRRNLIQAAVGLYVCKKVDHALHTISVISGL
jgi:hypothetical protein